MMCSFMYKTVLDEKYGLVQYFLPVGEMVENPVTNKLDFLKHESTSWPATSNVGRVFFLATSNAGGVFRLPIILELIAVLQARVRVFLWPVPDLFRRPIVMERCMMSVFLDWNIFWNHFYIFEIVFHPILRYHFLETGLSVSIKNWMGKSTVQRFLWESSLYMNKVS